MFRTKKDVDRHVQEILRKLKTENERNLRCYNIAKLYYQVGDYESARRYVSSYLEVRQESPAAHKLLGQTLEALGQKEAALTQFKTSLELEGRQDDLVLKVCELLADTDVGMDVSRARYWVERADKQFPHHPIVFQLKEKLLTIDRPNENAEDLEALIASELSARPMDVSLRVKLLRHYTDKNRLEDAYKHAAGVEAMHALRDNITWYQALCEMLAKCKDSKRTDWSYWVLYVSALERLAALSLKEQGDGPKKTVPEAAQAVFNFDQSLTEAEPHKKLATDPAFADQMFTHLWGQLHLHLASLLLRKTKREQGSWSEAGRLCSPLLLGALHTNPPDPTALWAARLKNQHRAQVQLWHREASYRCSQAGHVLHDYARDDTKRFLDKIDKFCTGAWRERVYQRIFVSRVHQQLMKNSYFAKHSVPNPPLRLCTHSELKHHDEVSEEVWPASLHHQVWLGIKSRPHHSHHKKDIGPHPHQYSHIFPELQLSVYNLNQAAADSLSRLDIDAFLNAAVLCASVVVEEQQRSGLLSPDRLPTLPADITNTVCTSAQENWWSAAYKMYREQEGVGGEVGEIRQVLQRGLEVVRCIGNHGLHPSLLVHLARIFHHRVKVLKEKDEEHSDIPALEARCELYWSAAVPLLERLQNNQAIRTSSSKLFDYQGKELNNVELTNALEEGRLLLAQRYLRDKQHEQAIEALQALKCPEASFQQGQIYKKLADELVSSLPRESLTSEMRSQHIIMLSKARDCFYLTLDRLRSPGTNPKHPLNSELCTHISAIENELKRIDPDLWRSDLNRNECDGMSDESYSSAHSGGDQPVINTSLTGISSSVHILSTPQRITHRTPKQSSTPRPQHQDVLELSRYRTEARPSPERLDAQIRQLIQSKDNVIHTFMEQNKAVLEQNKAVLEQNKIVLESNKAVMEQLADLKKEVADLRKETQKQRTQSTVSQNLEEDLYVLGEEDYGDLNYGSTTSAQPAVPTPSFPANMFPPAQRHPAYSQLVYPPAALQGYYQGALPFTDPTAQHIPPLYPQTVYPTPILYSHAPGDQAIGMLPKIPDSLLQPPQEALRFAPRVPNQMPEHLPMPDQLLHLQQQRHDPPKNEITIKDAPVNKAPPVNVVITTSDTLPTTAPTVQPTLSVTIPAHHRLGGTAPGVNVPHNYQISMPLQANIPTTVNLPPLSTTLTMSIPADVSVSEKPSRASTSILSTGSANDSTEWYAEVEHDPIPDFQPVIPLPAEIKVNTGEEGETTLYCARAKLFRFVDKEWKERGVGNVKLLRNAEGKVRLLMRRDQVHKICANHLIRADMELTKMPNHDKAWIWVANDFADEEVKLEKLCIRFKTEDEALNFKQSFEKAKMDLPPSPEKPVSKTDKKTNKLEAIPTVSTPKPKEAAAIPVVVGGFSFTSKPIIQEQKAADTPKTMQKLEEPAKPSPFAGFSFNKPDTDTKAPAISTVAPTVPVANTISFGAKPVDPQLTGFSFVKTTTADAQPTGFSFVKPPQAVATTPTFSFGKPVLPAPVTINVPAVTSTTDAVFGPAVQPTPRSASPITLFPPLRRPHAPTSAKLANRGVTPTKSEKSTAGSSTPKADEEETVDEFVPNAEFAPVIALPEEVEVITGEEGESILFEQRAKLLRFDAETKQWKERGIGQMKILLEEASGKIRLLMRRDQVLKVCCNHTLIMEMKFAFMAKNPKAVTWCAQDYSEGEIKPETFAIRFKTTEQASEFHSVIADNQKKMVNDRVPASENTDSKKSATATPVSNSVNLLTAASDKNTKPQKSLAEMFKPAAGSWECKECYTRNDSSKSNCIACSQPAPTVTISVPSATNDAKHKKSLAEMFKPAVGSWECKSCYTRNDGGKTNCMACEEPAPRVSKPAADKLASSGAPASRSWTCKSCYTTNCGGHHKCDACGDPQPHATAAHPATSSDKAPLSQMFKPAVGSWECKGCYIVNTGSNSYCVACDSPKDPTMPPKPKAVSGGFNIAASSASTPAFSFGIPQAGSKDPPGGFTFGIPKSDIKAAGDSTKSPSIISFGTPTNADIGTTFKFGISQDAQTPPNKESPFTFGSPGKSFDFHFQAKSPVKSPGGGETSDDEVAESEDVYFTPVIPLPDKVDVKTGEEDEEVLYSHRAKLFRFDSQSKEWKERGLGDIKLLKHKKTAKIRMIMRRDQVLKLCLNHIVPTDMEFTAKDDKTWLWYAADYSEGEIEHEQFACRFKTNEIAQDFKKAVEDAKTSATTPVGNNKTKTIMKSPETVKKNLFGDSSSSDVEVVYEYKVTPEEKAAALKLQLPDNFYAYKQKSDCPGCIGCKEPSVPLFTNSSTATKPVVKTLESDKPASPFSNATVFKAKPAAFATSTLTTASSQFDTTSATSGSQSGGAKTPAPSDIPSTAVTTLFSGSPNIGNSSFGENTAGSVFGSVNTPTKTTSTTSPSIFTSGFTTKSAIMSFGGNTMNTSNTMFGGSPATGTTSSASITFGGGGTPVFGAAKSSGFLLGPPPGQTNSTHSSTGPVSSSTPAGVFSFGASSDKSLTFGGKSDVKSIDDLKICSPTNFVPQTTSSTSTIFGGSGTTTVFGNAAAPTQSFFGGNQSATPVFGATTSSPNLSGSSNTPVSSAGTIFGGTGKSTPENSSSTTSMFSGNGKADMNPNTFTNMFGGSAAKTASSTVPNTTTTVFGESGKITSVSFGGLSSTSGFGATVTLQSNSTVFGANGNAAKPTFGTVAGKAPAMPVVFSNPAIAASPVFGGTPNTFGSKPVFGAAKTLPTFEAANTDAAKNITDAKTTEEEAKRDEGVPFLPTNNVSSFSTLAANSPSQPAFKKDPNFSFAGAGTSVFGVKSPGSSNSPLKPQSKKEQKEPKKKEEDDEDEEGEGNDGEEHDPHFEPIVPLPDAIEVRTGEEEEQKVFSQRAKLYRYMNATKEWKERGVGEMKLLHHAVHGTYRLLLRREQVHKVVCNLLLTPDLEFRTLNSSDRAWCWAGMNYAEDEPALEELAVRFKNPELAAQFKDAIDNAQQALREKQNINQEGKNEAEEGAPEDEEEDEDEDEDEDEVDEEDDEDEHSIMFEKRATLFARGDDDAAWKNVAMGDLKVLYDPDIFGARIVHEADASGNIVSNTVICMQTMMQVVEKECMWSAIDYALEPPVRRNLKAVFSSVQVAQEMYMNFQEGQSYARESEIIEPEYYIPGEE